MQDSGEHWALERLNVVEWAAKVIRRYAKYMGKNITEVVREAIVEKAMRIQEEGILESDTG